MSMNTYRVDSGAAVGGDGAATATSDPKPLRGTIVCIDLEYLMTPPAGTTDVTVRTRGQNGTVTNILVVTDAATDGRFYPTHLLHDAAAAAETDPTVGHGFPVDDEIEVVIAQANAADSVIAHVLVAE